MQLRDQSGVRAGNFEVSAVQLHDTIDQCQAQSASRLCTTLVQPDKPALDAFAVDYIDTGAGVSNVDNPASPVRWRNPDSYKRHTGFDIATIFHRVIKQIRHCLGYKLPVGAHQCRLRRIQNERATGLFCNGAIKLDQVLQQRHQVGILKSFAHLAGLGARN